MQVTGVPIYTETTPNPSGASQYVEGRGGQCPPWYRSWLSGSSDPVLQPVTTHNGRLWYSTRYQQKSVNLLNLINISTQTPAEDEETMVDVSCPETCRGQEGDGPESRHT
ncbi:hypothetical protein GDO81_019586 [Engystomops pustulosus]|uniref:Uncharacterized protein n=1 Tax=Engystomops pustulosus TaxID=76066 RepID=A0AAV6YAS1_ENGPU|nr:hypothetical protein GDO81_019586 [Engystomops pustulosus]